MKLLLVDDNDRIREVMRNICSPHFDEVIECNDGTEAVIAYHKNLPDWVVMDIKMKEMDGIEATIKILSGNPEARVIIISQFNDPLTVDAAKNAGAVEFVSKENLQKIIEVVKRNKQEVK
jgi:NarL family two-component system response regulator LiaR